MIPAHHRQPTKREVRRVLCIRNVAEAVGEIRPGCEIYGLTGGQWSLIDLIIHCLEATGPADVVVSTWTAASADIGFAFDLLRSGQIRSLRFLVDFSFPARQPAYCAALRERFGDDAIRVCKNHAKFVLIRAGQWNLVIRTSMNVNLNRRMESFEISDDAALAGYLSEIIAGLFAAETGAEAFSKRPIDHMKSWERTIGDGTQTDDAAAMRSTDAKSLQKHFDPSPFGNDLRRTGLSYIK